ncbi:uncharacterized protein [Apostichopus japonicus]
MDYVGKAILSNKVKGVTKELGFSDDQSEEKPAYDPEKEKEEERRKAEEKAKRDGIMNKKKAERAAKRNDIRAKYGLKESRNDVQMVEDHGPAGKSTGEEDSKCLVM